MVPHNPLTWALKAYRAAEMPKKISVKDKLQFSLRFLSLWVLLLWSCLLNTSEKKIQHKYRAYPSHELIPKDIPRRIGRFD